MSLARLVYYSGLFSGWAAFLGWLLAEILVLRGQGTRGGVLGLALVGGVVGAGIGAGLNLAAGLSNSDWKRLLLRIAIGLLGGGAGGLIGILVGNLAYSLVGLRFVGFMLLGVAVGVVDGLAERSLSKIRNGVLGGLVGGLIGGLAFTPLSAILNSDSGIASRATAFVILGLCVGALIGLAQVVLKEAWLTVLDGYRPGRQLILSRPVTVLGRGDHLPLPFIGPLNADLGSEHCRIVRQTDGRFWLEPIDTKTGVAVNHQKLAAACALADGDVIKLGRNYVRFNERRRSASGGSPSTGPGPSATAGGASIASVKPPPPPPGRPAPPPPKLSPAPPTPPPPKPSPQGTAPSAPPAAPAARPPGAIAPPPPPKPVIAPPPPPPRKPGV
ncbi:MAG: FHA domain-containing protein [Pirellulales bacterium]